MASKPKRRYVLAWYNKQIAWGHYLQSGSLRDFTPMTLAEARAEQQISDQRYCVCELVPVAKKGK